MNRGYVRVRTTFCKMPFMLSVGANYWELFPIGPQIFCMIRRGFAVLTQFGLDHAKNLGANWEKFPIICANRQDKKNTYKVFLVLVFNVWNGLTFGMV